jgi:hypothetical protein
MNLEKIELSEYTKYHPKSQGVIAWTYCKI